MSTGSPLTTTELDRFWLPPPLPRASTSSLPAIRAALPTFSSPALQVSRVGQLDASLLDGELETMLGEPVWKALAGIKSAGRRNWEPEMLAVLRLAVLRMSVWERGTTYGSGLQNLKYRNEREHRDGCQSTATDAPLTSTQKSAYIALAVLPPYLFSRLRDQMLSSSWADEPLPRTWLSLIDLRRASRRWRRRNGEEEGQWGWEWKRAVWEVINLGERIGAILGLANFLVFLYNGKYRTLVDRILGMRLISSPRSINRNVSFEFLNRQLVWEAFTEFLLFIMPLINLHRMRQRAAKLISNTTSNSSILSSVVSSLPTPVSRALGLPTRRAAPSAASANTPGEKPTTRPKGELHFLPPTTCPVCYSASNAPPTDIPSADPLATSALPSSTAPAVEDTTVKVPYVTDCGWEF
ncbi:hypothetical protein MNV49_007832 [Pseudohyphozyma bogoriensis]|nr:hypothetical protein MNV49_007832 [Pseudohyphozyma bogoriensis]